MLRILQAEFEKSSAKLSECPKSKLPEFAFIGRSNVGKSSLINQLCRRKSLAKTSSTPGKTQLINHFKLRTDHSAFEEIYFVDLPGYGYAKTSKDTRKGFTPLITTYTEASEALVNLFLLMDIRHVDQKIDHEFIEFLGLKQVPFSIVLTKSDKLSRNKQQKAVASLRRQLKRDWEEVPPIFITSSLQKEGQDDLFAFVEEVLNKMA